jgi:hypothetical protein
LRWSELTAISRLALLGLMQAALGSRPGFILMAASAAM